MKPSWGMRLESPKQRVYELQQLLGRGGFGSVWRAQDVSSKMEYAVKVFEAGDALATEEDVRQAHEREVVVLHDVHGPRCRHIVRMDEPFRDVDSDLYCIVMGLAGESLQQRMLSAQPYTLADVLRWVRHLATALACLSSLPPEPVVHGDINPDNLLLSGSSSSSPSSGSDELVLGDMGGAMWQGLRAGLRLGPWDTACVMPSAFVAPERRPDGIVHGLGLSAEVEREVADRVVEKVGGVRVDVWSLGVVAYLLGLRKDPRGYDRLEDKVNEVDDVARKPDARGWLHAQLRQCWQDEEEGQLRVLAEVIAGALHWRLDGRLSANEVLELMGPAGTEEQQQAAGPTLPELMAQHKQALAERLRSLPGLLGDERVSLLEEDVVPLDLLPNDLGPDAVTRGLPDDSREQQQQQQARPVTMGQLLSGEVCGKGLSVILGPPGAGKTTLLHHLALRMATQHEEVPVVVHAQGLLEGLASCADVGRPEALLAAVAAGVDGALKSAGYPDSLLAIGRSSQEAQGRPPVLALLVDGLDEVADRARLLQRLLHVQAGSASPFRRVIVCSRPGAFESLKLDGRCLEAVLQALPLDQQQSERLAAGLLKQWAVDGDAALAGRVRELARSTFQGSPLLLYLLCILARERREVPDSRTGLFEQMLRLCLRRAEAKEGALGRKLQWDADPLLELCGLVAYLVHRLGWQDRKEVVLKQELVDALSSILRSEAGRPWAAQVFGPRYVLKQAVAEALEGFSGLLCQQGRLGYRMLHRTLQEYLAARFLAGHSTDPLLLQLRQHVCAGQWGSGEQEEGEKAVVAWRFEWWDEALITADWWGEVYCFAGLLRGPTWLAERMLQLPETGGVRGASSVQAWLGGIGEAGFDRDDVGMRRLRHVLRASAGGGRLPRAKDTETAVLAVEAVRQVLRRHPALAATIVYGSAGYGTFLSQHEWCCLPGEPVTALCGDLVQRLSGPYGLSHATAFRLLGQAAASRPGVVGALLDLLSHAGVVAQCATEALGYVGRATTGRPSVVEPLMGLLSHADTEVAGRAAQALGNMGQAAASGPGVVEALRGLLSRADILAGYAAEALGYMGEAACRPGVVEALVDLLKHADVNVAGRAAAALSNMGEAATSRGGVAEGLVGMLGHADSRMAWLALKALGSMGEAAARTPGVVEALVGLLSQTELLVAETAAKALCRMGEAAASRPGVVEALVSLLNHGDLAVALRAAVVLDSMGEAATSSLAMVGEPVDPLSHASAAVMEDPAKALLDKIGEVLVGMLGHAELLVAEKALRALGRMGEAATSRPGVVEALVGLLNHAELLVAETAAKALCRMGEAAASRPGVVEALVGLLSHADTAVALRAAVVLDSMGEAATSSLAVVEAPVGPLGHASAAGMEDPAKALGRTRKAVASRPGDVEALVSLLDCRQPRAAWNAASVLWRLSIGSSVLLRIADTSAQQK